MPILYRYLIREILKHIAIVLAVVVSIYVTVDVVEKTEKILGAGISMSRAFDYFLFSMPFVIAQVFPLAVLLAVLIVFGRMSKHNEIIALNSSGISIYYLFKPLFLIGISTTVFLFFFSEGIAAKATEKAERIWREEIRHQAAVISKEKDIWFKADHLIISIRYYNPKEQTIFGVGLNYFDENFGLIRKVDAQKGVFRNGVWILSDLIEQKMDKSGKNDSATVLKELREPLKFAPRDLTQVVKRTSEMSFVELRDYVRRVESEGYDATTYRTDLHAKVAFPFICLILCLVGTGISARAKIKEGLSLCIASGLGVAFVYWIFHSFCVSLGYGEMLPPIVAAWSANIVFFCLGLFLLINAE